MNLERQYFDTSFYKWTWNGNILTLRFINEVGQALGTLPFTATINCYIFDIFGNIERIPPSLMIVDI